jgi:hypothetical protein
MSYRYIQEFDEMGRQTERDFEEQFKDMQTNIIIYLNA